LANTLHAIRELTGSVEQLAQTVEQSNHVCHQTGTFLQIGSRLSEFSDRLALMDADIKQLLVSRGRSALIERAIMGVVIVAISGVVSSFVANSYVDRRLTAAQTQAAEQRSFQSGTDNPGNNNDPNQIESGP